MTPVLYNSSPISQKGGVAVLCPVAVLGTFHYDLTMLDQWFGRENGAYAAYAEQLVNTPIAFFTRSKLSAAFGLATVNI